MVHKHKLEMLAKAHNPPLDVEWRSICDDRYVCVMQLLVARRREGCVDVMC